MNNDLIKKASSIAVLLAIISLGLYFRLFPVTVNQLRQNINFSRMAVYMNIRKVVTDKINKAYPQMPEEKKNKLISAQLKNIMKDESRNVDKAVNEMARRPDKILSRFYLLEADPYFYLYLTKKVLQTGRLSDVQKNGEYLDSFMMAPTGFWRSVELHPYIGAAIYRFLSLFYGKISLITALAGVPLLFFALSASIFVLICGMLNMPKFITLISGLFFSLSPIFIQRSAFGWYDTDPYNVLFILLVIVAVCKISDGRQPLVWAMVLAGINALFALVWQGWLLLPALSILALSAVIAYRIICKKDAKAVIKDILVFCLALPVFAAILLTPKGLASSLSGTLGILSEFVLFNKNTWPDIFISVGELSAPTYQKLVHILGGYLFFYLSVAGMAVMLFGKAVRIAKEKVIIILFFALALYAMSKSAERFIIFFLVPLSLSFASGLLWLSGILRSTVSKVAKFLSQGKVAAVSYILISLLLISPVLYAYVSASNENPIFNKVWDDVLNKIRISTSPDSIINSWWCPGHFIKAIAERRVTFDGATMNSPQAYWMASFFMTDDEKEALGILRMLNSSGNAAADYLTGKGIPLYDAVDIIKKIVRLEKKEAYAALIGRFSEKDAEHLLSLTHGSTPPSYCLIYNDLIDGAIGLYYVKNWDFKKAETVERLRYEELKKGNLFWRGSKDNISTLWSISGGNTYIGAESYETARVGDIAYFDNGLMVNMATMEAKLINLSKEVSGVPESIITAGKDGFTEKKSDNPAVRLSVMLIPHPDTRYSTVVAPANVLKSVLFRLYYLDGIGLNGFKRFAAEDSPALNTRIIVYKAD